MKCVSAAVLELTKIPHLNYSMSVSTKKKNCVPQTKETKNENKT